MSSIKKVSNSKEVPMRTLTLSLCLASMFALAACGGTTTVEGPMPVEIDGNVAILECIGEGDCTANEDCDADKLCVLLPGLSEKCGMAVMKCVAGCDADLQKNVDGTTTKVDGTDTCQRDGDMTLYCDMESHVCEQYVVEPDPTDPGTPPDPTDADKYYQVTCCFNKAALKPGMYMQASASTSTEANPESSAQDTDLSLNNGCASSTKKFVRGSVFLGYWVELTQGKAEDWVDMNSNGKIDDGEIVKGTWLGAGPHGEYLPLSCSVDEVAVQVGPHMPTCGVGIDDAVGKSCRN